MGMPEASATSFDQLAVGHVEQQGAAGFLHVHGELAGQTVADVVLRAEHVGDLGEDLRLVLAHPEELGEGEVGQRGVAGQRDQTFATDLRFQPIALRVGCAGRTR
jgi:hypothetical protein